MKKYNYKIILGWMVIILSVSSCKEYLDIVPDNVATIDNAFTIRNEAEKYLFSCYSYLPRDGSAYSNAGFMSGDEIWIPLEQREFIVDPWKIARGNQNANEPIMNAWDGTYNGAGIFKGIRACNIFLENLTDLTKVRDITLDERQRWIGEAEFLKAYFHFYLLRMYGPIPIIDKNLPIDAPAEDVRVKRMPVDETVDYISALLDTAAAKLPAQVLDNTTELGRITRPIALAVKAKLLLMAASPLFNGNPDYANFKDKDGVSLFNSTVVPEKWEKAATAAKLAIDAAEATGAILYEFDPGTFRLSDTTITQMSIRNGFNERWLPEHIWANSNSLAATQGDAMAPLIAVATSTSVRAHLAAPLKIAEMFYSSNGVPIGEDNALSFTNRTTLRTATHDERFNIREGYQTARLNFDREPRFYASLGFDGGVWYKRDSPTLSDEGTFYLQGKANQQAGANNYGWFNETGYFLKKLVNWEMVFTSTGVTYRAYPWPQIRLSDVYLMYAEALNETTSSPSSDVYKYIDKVRARAGLKGVVESWSQHSTNPNKPSERNGMREIIRQERLIELAFEGSRFWDLRRWKVATEYLNQNITGWSVHQTTAADYYKIRSIFPQTFVAPRDYFWPIKNDDLVVNPNLVQNPGW